MNNIQSQNNNQILIKGTLIGDDNVGKSCILNQYVNKLYQNLPTPIGIDFKLKNVFNNGVNHKLQLWDTAGQERYRSITPTYMKKSYFSIIVFDVSCKQSFDNIEFWINMHRQNVGEFGIIMLAGNKVDLQQQHRKVSKQQILQKAKQFNLPYFQVSAKTGLNIEHLFAELIKSVDYTFNLKFDHKSRPLLQAISNKNLKQEMQRLFVDKITFLTSQNYEIWERHNKEKAKSKQLGKEKQKLKLEIDKLIKEVYTICFDLKEKDQMITVLKEGFKTSRDLYEATIEEQNNHIKELKEQIASAQQTIALQLETIERFTQDYLFLDKIQTKSSADLSSFSVFEDLHQKYEEMSLYQTSKQCQNCLILSQKIAKIVEGSSIEGLEETLRERLKQSIRKLEKEKNWLQTERVQLNNLLNTKQSEILDLNEEILSLKKKLKKQEQ